MIEAANTPEAPELPDAINGLLYQLHEQQPNVLTWHGSIEPLMGEFNYIADRRLVRLVIRFESFDQKRASMAAREQK